MSVSRHKRQQQKPKQQLQQKQQQVLLDHAAFPAIFEEILKNPACWTAMRGVCRALRERMDAQLFNHIVIRVDLQRKDTMFTEVRSAFGYLPVIPNPAPWNWERTARNPQELEQLRSCISSFLRTRVVDVPGSGRGPFDLEHLVTCLHLVDVLRFYACGVFLAQDRRLKNWKKEVNKWTEASIHANTLIVLFPYIPDTARVGDLEEADTYHWASVGTEVRKVVVNVGYSLGTGPFAPLPPPSMWVECWDTTPITLETVYIFHPLDQAVLCDSCHQDLTQTPPDCDICACSVKYREALWDQFTEALRMNMQGPIASICPWEEDDPQEVEEYNPGFIRFVNYPTNTPEKWLPGKAFNEQQLVQHLADDTANCWTEHFQVPREPPPLIFQSLEEYTAGMTPREIELETVGNWKQGGW